MTDDATLARMIQAPSTFPAWVIREALTELAQLRSATVPPPAPEVLVMVESDPDEPDVLMGGPFLICPHADCNAEDDIRQVDVVTRWNNARVNLGHDSVVVSDGGSDDGEDHGYICGTCERPVSFPESMDRNRYWV
jgi:hypothetical protein